MSETEWKPSKLVAVASKVRYCRIKDEQTLFDDGLWHVLRRNQRELLPCCTVDRGDDHYAPARANAERYANLFAAAPGLLEALEKCAHWMESYSP